ncbi:carboxypeptidase B [Anabrus simplex]|uniref:carboxypeptidase B n=1 Tax=Anabrus simplex TaxID=316456 RepID=UPI0035A2B334
MRVISALLLISFLGGCLAEFSSYSGYKIVETEVLDTNALKTLYPHSKIWDFLSGPRLGRPARILVAPKKFEEVKRVLISEKISFSVLLDDLQRQLDEDQKKYYPLHQGRSISFNKYNTLSEINAYLDDLAKQYPDLVSVQSIGNSTEGRPVNLIKISSGGGNKPAIFVEGTVHAREWLAPAVTTYIINQLTENYTANRELVDNVDWYVIPVLNVDGYEYTQKERFWRKTRSDTGDPECIGVDGNRNFAFHWNEWNDTNPCTEIYPGKSTLSEPETRAVSDFATAIKDNIKLYISVHSCSSVLLYPWGYTEEPPADAADLQSLGDKAMAALEAVRGTKYLTGPTVGLMYYAAGTSHDWAKGTLGVKYSYTIELPCGGSQGFDPPATEILPVVTETFEAFKVFGNFIGSGGK